MYNESIFVKEQNTYQYDRKQMIRDAIFILALLLLIVLRSSSSYDYLFRCSISLLFGFYLICSIDFGTKSIYLRFDENKNILLLDWTPQDKEQVLETIPKEEIKCINYNRAFNYISINFFNRKPIKIRLSYLQRKQQEWFASKILYNYPGKLTEKVAKQISTLPITRQIRHSFLIVAILVMALLLTAIIIFLY